MRPAPVAWRAMNITTPTKMSKGESQLRSNENTTAIMAVPTSAPSITASAAAVGTRPLPTKLATIRQVAVLLCTRLVTPRPASSEVNRLPKLRARMARRFSPNTRSMPVRTMCVPQTSRAIAARRFSKWVKFLPSERHGTGFAGPLALPPGGLRPDTNGVPFVPAEGLGLGHSATCKGRQRRFGGGHTHGIE